MLDVRGSCEIEVFLNWARGLTLNWAIVSCVLFGGAYGQVAVRDEGFLPFRNEPINYLSDRVNDPIAKLQERLDQGKVKLKFEPKHGYLKSVMDLLELPVSSQTLVFSKYLSAHSDIVAHLVLAHQTQMHNLITVANYKTRLALHADKGAISETTRRKIEGPSEDLLRYLLFTDEASFEEPIVGSSSFAKDFAAKGPRDPKGRSLRDFDLRRRVFKYPCSYLIYSEAFDALPKPSKDFVYRRLLEILTGQDRCPEFARLSPDDRRAILEILIATKPDLPGDWKRSATTSIR